jgi:nucleoside 2-deoxyribosyltransferase
MRLYLAAPFKRKSEVFDIAGLLRNTGVDIASSWVLSSHTADGDVSRELLGDEWIKNIHDLQTADVLVFLNLAGWYPEGAGGKHYEAGYAHAMGLPLLLVGERSHSYHCHPAWRWVPSVHGLILWVEEQLRTERLKNARPSGV